MLVSCLLSVLLLLAASGARDAPAPQAANAAIDVHTHDPTAARTINEILSDPHYWDLAWTERYDDEHYDVIRFVELERGYVPMVSGEGDRDLPRAVVEDAIFRHLDQLPRHIDLVDRVAYLGRGHDPVVGHDYADVYLLFDATILTIHFGYRMYRASTGSS